jgi:hypothetical protein
MLKTARRPMLAAALCCCASFSGAQTTPNIKPAAKPSAPVIPMAVVPTTPAKGSATATVNPLNSGIIYRWTDRQGRAQYGPVVPEEFKATARKIDTRTNIVSSRVPASIGSALPGPELLDEPAGTSKAKIPATERDRCEAAWQQYNEAQACFAKYRQSTAGGAGKRAGSNISEEALKNCQSLTEPAPCR